MEQAYNFYLRTSRLDLDDYNNEVRKVAILPVWPGTWMSIVEGFGGMRIVNDQLCFTPQIPEQWEAYSFKVNFRNKIVKIEVTAEKTSFSLEGDGPIEIMVNGKKVTVGLNEAVAV
jgi:maltose phosphorylase